MAVPAVFDQPGAAFVLLPDGIKFPPIEKEWQKKGHSFEEASAHLGNVGIMAGNGYIGVDQDDPEAFEGLQLPSTTTWETRPGRFGMWFKCSEGVADALAKIGKKADQAQLKLFKDGKPCGEIKLERTYQVIPPSWKDLEDGSRADYRLLQEIPPAEISMESLLADLQALGITFSSKLETNAAKVESSATKAHQSRMESDEARTRRYAEAALRDEALTLVGTPAGHRNEQLNKSAFAMGQFVAAGVLSEAEVNRELSKAAMNAGLELEEIRATIMSGLEAGARHPRDIPEQGMPKPEAAREMGLEIPDTGFEELTEGGNASRLERIHGDDMRYCHTFKKWLLWENGRWNIDSNGGAMRKAEDMVGALYLAASKSYDKEERARITGFAQQTDSRRGLTNLLAIAANRLKFSLTSDNLDSDPWLLGAGDATINLKDGTVQEPRREDLITKAAGARYDPAAKYTLWMGFLGKIFGGDQDLIKYVQRAVGYSLTGSMVEQVYFFCHGTGANGKSVFLATLRALLGDYARQASFDTFLVQRTAKVRNDLAALAGARVVVASEAEEGSKLSMQVIKSWTGGDPITARFLFGEDFTFKPVGKLWLAANTKPAISERNYAAWRRVHLIPFSITIPPEEQDRELENKLLGELPGILNWALGGLKEYQRIGLQPPEAVRAATDAYRRENDSMAAFIAECCEMQKLGICKNSDLFSAYQAYCKMNDEEAISQKKFSEELIKVKGIRKTRDRSFGIIWHGIQLAENWSDPSQTVKNDRDGARGEKDVKPNSQSSSNSPRVENLVDLASHPSRTSTDGDCPSQGPSQDPPAFTVEEKAKLWDDIRRKLRKYGRLDGARRGLASSDLGAEELELIRAAGWQLETTGQGISIWWAPEKTLAAMGLEAAG